MLNENNSYSKRRSYNAPETREEPVIHPSAKQAAIYGSMKEEPINKKLMELAEGRLCTTTREKSTDNFQKKNQQKDKPEIKEPVAVESKRPVADESLQTLHTESDLSDISDDPDDILNMEEDTTVHILYFYSYFFFISKCHAHTFIYNFSTGYGN